MNDNRFHAAIRVVEASLPTEPLTYAISENITLEHLDDPAAWLTAKLMVDDMDFICNGNKHAYVKVFARAISPTSVLEGEWLAFMNVIFPDTPEFTSRMPDLVRAIGPAVRAYRIDASPSDTMVAIIDGAGRANPPPQSEVRLPPSTPSAIPRHIGWLNYWSNESCRLLEFSPEDPRAHFFTRVTPIEGHGVMLYLTEEPLDLDRPEHLAALTAAYDAFPTISQAYGP